jgi:hypothetical protein
MIRSASTGNSVWPRTGRTDDGVQSRDEVELVGFVEAGAERGFDERRERGTVAFALGAVSGARTRSGVT